MKLKIKKIHDDAIVPKKAYIDDAGLDLYISHNLSIKPLSRSLAKTGILIQIPIGYAGFVQPKSGLAINKGITVLNTPGLIDSGYRGEIGVILFNSDKNKIVKFNKGDKVAQLVIIKLPNVEISVVKNLSETKRSNKGFGSSGK